MNGKFNLQGAAIFVALVAVGVMGAGWFMSNFRGSSNLIATAHDGFDS